MRFSGKIKKWNDERGFGFIQPSGGGSDIFAHISDFPKRHGLRPKIEDNITFEIASNHEGKKKAVNIEYLTPGGAQSIRSINKEMQKNNANTSRARNIFMIIAAVASVLFLLLIATAPPKTPVLQKPGPIYRPTPTQHPVFSCDGRTHCSQMTSCAEAKYFLNNCPGAQMDGNNDGTPCEKQWCNNPLSN